MRFLAHVVCHKLLYLVVAEAAFQLARVKTKSGLKVIPLTTWEADEFETVLRVAQF